MHEVPFLAASTVPRSFTVVSEIASALGHWDSSARAFRACGREVCFLCREGLGREVRYLVRLEDSQGGDYLLWLRPRHREVVERVLAAQTRGLSVEVEIWKAGAAVNSPVELRILREVSSRPLYQVRNLMLAVVKQPILIDADGSKVEFDPSLVSGKCSEF